MNRILVIDDEKNVHYSFKRVFKDLEILSAYGAEEGLEILNKDCQFSLIISDIKMSGMSGLDLLDELKKREVTIPVVIITAHGTLENAINAIKQGAYDYLIKPFDFQKLKSVIYSALSLPAERTATPEEVEEPGTQRFLIGNSAMMQDVYREIAKVAQKDITVLITGESGTGKEMVAKAIHYYSTRKSEPFVAVNCGAIPSELIESELFGFEKGAFTGAHKKTSGRFQQAHGGTLFLDEVGELPLHLQVKILRALQEREITPLGAYESQKVDVRIIAATNRDLKEEIKAGNFREDLFYRLNVVRIHLPPLRDRKDDIPFLIDYFLLNIKKMHDLRIMGFSEEAMQKIMHYNFPGNVRELENIVTRAAVSTNSEIIQEEDIDLDFSQEYFTTKMERNLENVIRVLYEREIKVDAFLEKVLLSTLMKIFNFNQSKAADYLEINRNTLRKKLQDYELL